MFYNINSNMYIVLLFKIAISVRFGTRSIFVYCIFQTLPKKRPLTKQKGFEQTKNIFQILFGTRCSFVYIVSFKLRQCQKKVLSGFEKMKLNIRCSKDFLCNVLSLNNRF